MPVTPRPEVAALRPVVHGAAGATELAAHGLSPDDVLDFSVNTNPLGPGPAVLEGLATMSAAEVARYPDGASLALRQALANRLGVGVDQIVAGNGSSELIWLLALAYAPPAPRSVLIAGPTFGEYERACRLAGATISFEHAAESNGFAPPVDHLRTRILAERPSLVWLCNPNNPTSVYLRRAAVASLLEACVASGALLVVDEAYLAFVREPDSLLDLVPSGHLLLLRSLTKDYALAGLRLGYALGTPALVDALRAVQPPWSVNAAALRAGAAALADEAHQRRAQEEVWAARQALVDGLPALGFPIAAPPAANFVLVRAGSAAGLRQRLLPSGCVVRDCTSFGLPGHVRIAVRTRSDGARLLRAMAALLPNSAPGVLPALGERNTSDDASVTLKKSQDVRSR